MIQSAGRSLQVAEQSHHDSTTESSSQNPVNDKSDGTTLYVGNLSFKVKHHNFKVFFRKFGRVTYTHVAQEFVTGKSKGYGFVRFSDREEAQRVLNAVPKQLRLYGRTLQVDLAHRKSAYRIKVDVSGENEGFHEGESAQTDSPMSILTDDLLVRIFEYLTPLEVMKIESVCKRWRRCALAAATQRRQMELILDCRYLKSLKDGGFYYLMSRSCNLVSLNLSCVTGYLYEYDPLKIIAHFAKNIQKLEVRDMHCSNKGLEFLARECTQLKSLVVRYCPKLLEKGFLCLFKHCKKLEHLDCTGNIEFTGRCLAHATSAFKSLHASKCLRLTEKGILNIAKKCHSMETLKLKNCPLLTNETVSVLAKSLPELKVLCLGNYHHLQSLVNSADHFVQHFVNPGIIVKLKLFNCSLVDINLQFICANCPLLSHLDISCNVLTDASVIQLAALKYLQYLSACDLCNITDVSLVDVAKQGRLRQLLVQGSYRLTDKLMQSVAENCLQIEQVDVAGIPSISVASLTAFRESCLRRASTPPLVVYTSDNNFDPSTTIKLFNVPNLHIYDDYRTLYPRIVGFVADQGEELDVARAENPVFPNPYQCGRVLMLPADLVECDDSDSDDNFICSDDGLAEGSLDNDDFLENDDFLPCEKWNPS